MDNMQHDIQEYSIMDKLIVYQHWYSIWSKTEPANDEYSMIIVQIVTVKVRVVNKRYSYPRAYYYYYYAYTLDEHDTWVSEYVWFVRC